jgi:hypothetical protein
MDPEGQPGVLGFAYVPIAVDGTIDTDNFVQTGVIGSVTRSTTGVFEVHIFDYTTGGDLAWPWGFAFGVISDAPLSPCISWHSGVGDSNPVIILRGPDNIPADPSGTGSGFTINILPT